jgi:hypothetical protein
MRLALAFFCVLLVAVSATAQGVYNMAKQEARNVANGNPPQSGAPSAAPPPQSNPQTDPALAATLQNIENLHYDFAEFDSNPTNTRPLIKDLTAAAQSAQPKPDSVSQLAGHLASVFVGNKKLSASHQKLAQYVHALFNSSHLTAAQQQMVLEAVQKILQDGGVPADDAASVIGDLKTIATETK